MSVYHQMGHDSNNLLDLPELSLYSGAIYSPINAALPDLIDDVKSVKAQKPSFDVLFDPQLYVPATGRGRLKEWSYFPKNIDTADFSASWWKKVVKSLCQDASKVGCDAICSPVIIPKSFSDDYYSQTLDVACDLQTMAAGGERVLQTVLVPLGELSDTTRVMQIASLVSQTQASSVYVIFVGNVEPRRELSDPMELSGAMKFVAALQKAHLDVTVGFTSSDVLLWKHAGATRCASGKFFNLRRFTRDRFEDSESEGGGQLPYWFEEGLMAFLREPDLFLIKEELGFSEATEKNPFSKQILAKIAAAKKSGQKPKWLALSWRFFLFWFSDVEKRLSLGTTKARTLLKTADANWNTLEEKDVLVFERRNDGSWAREWLNAIKKYES